LFTNNSVHAATHQGQKPKRYRSETRYHMICHKRLHLRTRKPQYQPIYGHAFIIIFVLLIS